MTNLSYTAACQQALGHNRHLLRTVLLDLGITEVGLE